MFHIGCDVEGCLQRARHSIKMLMITAYSLQLSHCRFATYVK